MLQKFYLFLALIALGLSPLHAEDWDQRIYLATYPKSGNHWMRHLIEEATHIATGSVYRDMDNENPHLKAPFAWGYAPDHGYKRNCRYPKKNETYVIKTHFPAMKASKKFDNKPFIKTIRIVRHPVDAFHSFYSTNPSPEVRKSKEDMQDFLLKFRKFQEYWDKQPNVITVRYEDLYDAPHAVLRKVLKAIGYTFKEADIERAVANNPPHGGTMKYLKHFHPKDLMQIVDELSDIMDKYHYTIPDSYLIKPLN